MDRNEVAAIVRDELRRSDLAALVRQATLVGPFSANSGSLAAGVGATITFTHNAGMKDGLSYRVLVEQEDGGFGYLVGWVVTARTANDVTIAFRNNGPVAATLFLGYFLKPINA